MRVVSLALAFVLIISCPYGTLASESISFPSARLYEKDTDTQGIDGYLFKPEGAGPFPAVVLLHANGGVTKHLTENWSEFLTGLGYAVLVPRSNESRGIERGTRGNLNTRSLNLMKDGYGALDALAERSDINGDAIAVMGFSLGANAINQIMYGWKLRNLSGREFKAAVPLYGRCERMKSGYDPNVNVPILQIIPELDNVASRADQCITLNKLWGMETLILKDTHHAFDNPLVSGRTDGGGHYMEYSDSATVEARAAILDFLVKHLGN